MAHTLDTQALRDWMTPREVERDGVHIPAEAVPVARRADVLPGVWRWVFKTRVGGTATLGCQDVMYVSPRNRGASSPQVCGRRFGKRAQRSTLGAG